MRRKLFTLASALSLLLCLATLVLWARSYYRLDCVSLCFASHLEIAARLEQGTAALMLTRFPKAHVETKFEAHAWRYSTNELFESWSWMMYRFPSSFFVRELWGYEEGHFPGARIYSSRQEADADSAIPDYKRWYLMPRLWVVVAAFGILPLASVLRFWARRCRAGECQSCRYDLTGNTSGVCPECGTAVTAKAGA